MIVLTGGAGFIGSCFLKALNDRNIYDILVVDRLSETEKWKNLIGKRFSGYEHKVKFREKLNAGFYNNKIDAIVHLGACSATTERDVDYLFDNNLSYSKEMAEFAFKSNIKFMYASSAATYGGGENGYSDYNFDNLHPLNAYGLSKHLFDQWLIDNNYTNKVIGLKYFNVFGPNEYHKSFMTSMVNRSFHQVKEAGKVKLFKSYVADYGHGQQMRDFIYVKDAVDVMIKMFESDSISGIFNLGTGKARSWNDLANAVFKALKLDPIIEYIEMPDQLKNQYQYYTQADMKKLSQTDCMISFRSLEESVEDYVVNHLAKEFPFL